MGLRLPAAAVLILGPLFWCVGLALRASAVAGFTPDQVARFAAEPFAVREQLAAYVADPALTVAGYATFLVGAILLIPAVAALAGLAARRAPWLAVTGGLLLAGSLVARVYFTGVEQTAFALVDAHGVDAAASTVLGAYTEISYGPWRVPVVAVTGQYVGAPLLAAALYRAGVFGGVRVAVLLWWATMWGGVLKTAGWWDVVAGAALLAVLAEVAIRLVRDGTPGERRGRALLSW